MDEYLVGTMLLFKREVRHLSKLARIEQVGNPFNGPNDIYSVRFENGECRLYSHKELIEQFVVSPASAVLFGKS